MNNFKNLKYCIIGNSSLINEFNNNFGKPILSIELPPYINILGDSIDYSLLLRSIYPKIQLENLVPLDDEILSKLIDCEVIYLKMVERLLNSISYQQRKDEYLYHLRFWNDFFIKNNFNYFIFSNVPHEGFDFIIYSLCKIYNVKTFCMVQMPMIDKKVLLLNIVEDIFDQSKEIRATYNKIKNNNYEKKDLSLEFQTYINTYTRNKAKDLDFISFSHFSSVNKNSKSESLKLNLKIEKGFELILNFKIFLFLKKLMRFAFMYIPLDQRVQILFRDPYLSNRKKIDKLLKKTQKKVHKLPKKFIYFPLHNQPEASTSPMARNFVDQSLIIDMLVYATRNTDIEIIVKEHRRPQKLPYSRTAFFYKKISSYKRVTLIDSNENNYELIKKSFAVASLNGSSGFEAILSNKSVLMFGSRFYDSMPNCYKIVTNDDLKNSLILISKKIKFNSKEIYKHLKAIELNSIKAFKDISKLHWADQFSIDQSNRNIVLYLKKILK